MGVTRPASPELAITAASPRPNRAILDRHAEKRASRYSGDATVHPRYRHGQIFHARIAVPQLAHIIPSPRIHSAVLEREAMIIPGRDCYDSGKACDRCGY